MPVTTDTWEMEKGGMLFKANPGKNVNETVSQRISWV
jgi:hypothetical protein